MFCPKCGASVSDGANFCEKCGAPIEAAEGYSAAWGAEMNANTFYAQPAAPVAMKNCGKAIAGFVLSLVAFVMSWLGIILSILGIVFSTMALREIRNNRNLTGRGFALAGLIISIVDLSVWTLMLMLVFVIIIAII